MTQTRILLETEFLPADRAADAVISRQREVFAQNALINQVLNSMPEGVLILNEQRQIVFSNEAFRAVVGGIPEALGQRPGEALLCEHSTLMAAGCGTSQFCQTCGAAKAIQSALDKQKAVQECRIARDEETTLTALDLRVVATPFVYNKEDFILFAIDDISNEKRREALERIFFHDIQNTAGAISGVAQLLDSLKPSELDDWHIYGSMLRHASNQLLEEIQEQRQLIAAENGDLYVEWMPIYSLHLLTEVRDIYAHHDVATDKQIQLNADTENVIFLSDPVLVRRVIGNMTKNALEASSPHATITLGCAQEEDGVRFWVHNPNTIPHAVQLQLFKRSFTTKGYGRGLGTYSMKLLTERYLQGRVGFASSQDEGTTFYAWLPLKPSVSPGH